MSENGNEMEQLFCSSPDEQLKIVRNVGNFTVALFGVDGANDYRSVNLVGSGTLVTLGKSHYVLTAAHVWRNGLKKYESTGLTLKEDLDHCFPILNGTPGALSKGVGKIQVVEIQGMYVSVDAKFYDHDKFDLIDFEMDTTLPQVIEDFRGVSGGGVWDVQIFPTGDGRKFDSVETLVGVAFYQLGLKDKIQTVRCHGPKTIHALIESTKITKKSERLS